MKKKLTLLCWTLWMATLSYAQAPFVKGESVMTYALPKTEFVIEVVSEKITEQPGQFYLYAQRYLGTTNVIKTPKSYYRFKHIRITTRTIPDPQRTYRILPKKKSPTNLIATNGLGILSGINTPPPPPLLLQKEAVAKTVDPTPTLPPPLPLVEEYMLAGSVAKMAEGAAKQIYRIRESRIDLLGGYVENIPKDGEAVKTLIAQMEIEEKKLTKLFVGSLTVETIQQTILFAPSQAAEDLPIFRFSEHSGVVAADDLSGRPIYLTLRYQPYRHIESERKKRKSKYQEVFTVIPIFAQMRLTYEGKKLYDEQVVLPQLGVLQPIPFGEIRKNSQIYVDTHTGKLKSIVETK